MTKYKLTKRALHVNDIEIKGRNIKWIALLLLFTFPIHSFSSVSDAETRDREYKIMSDKISANRFKISVVDGYHANVEYLGIFTKQEILKIADEISKELENLTYLYGAGLVLGTIITSGGLAYGVAIVYAAGFVTATGTGLSAYSNYELATNGQEIVSQGIVDAHDKVTIMTPYAIKKVIKKLKSFKH
jgi:hypothetical protein